MRLASAPVVLNFFIVISLVGCGSQQRKESTPIDSIAIDAAPVSDAPPPSQAPEIASGASPTAHNNDTAQVAASGYPSLSQYLGKSPTESVGRVDWNHNPEVLAGIHRSVTDQAVREAIQDDTGPAALIEMIDGKISSWACEAHNCGDHQWMTMIDATSGATDVCYHNAAQLADKSRWFTASGHTEVRPGNCTIE